MKKFLKAFAIALVILAFLIDMLDYSFKQIQNSYLEQQKISYIEYRFPSFYYLIYPQKKSNRYYTRFIKEGFGNIITSTRVDTVRLIRALQKQNRNPHNYLEELLYIWNAQLAPFNAISSKQELKHWLYNYDTINQHPIYYQRTQKLHQAQDKQSIETLLSRGATINDMNRQWQHILHFAHDSHLTQYIIEQGASINHFDNQGNTPLMNAIKNYQKTKNQEYFKIIQLLLAHHADTRKALRVTLDSEIAKLLLAHDANVNEIDIYGHSVLHDLIYTNHYAIIEFLINHGADINHIDNIKRSLLHKTTNPDTIVLLLNKGIDTTLRNDQGKTAYEYWLSKYEEFKKYPLNVYHLRHHKAYYDATVTYETYHHLPKKIKKFEPNPKYAIIKKTKRSRYGSVKRGVFALLHYYGLRQLGWKMGAYWWYCLRHGTCTCGKTSSHKWKNF